MFDLQAYLERIGLGPRATRRSIAPTSPRSRSRTWTPSGIPVSLDLGDLQRKLVAQRRGGYCFEHNLLLSAALTRSASRSSRCSPAFAWVARRARPRPRTHLVLRVRDGDRVWLADVGFGNGTLLEPIPFGPGGEHDQSGWRFRLVQDGAEHVLQTSTADGWSDVYGFVPEPVPAVDIETSNWFTCTHPGSPFVTGIIVSAHAPDGRRSMLRNWDGLALKEQTPSETTVTPVEYRDPLACAVDPVRSDGVRVRPGRSPYATPATRYWITRGG